MATELRQPAPVFGHTPSAGADLTADGQANSSADPLEVKPRDRIYVMSHGPAEVVTNHGANSAGITMVTVRFPDGTEACVKSGQILAHVPSPSGIGAGTVRRTCSTIPGPRNTPGPRNLEYFGRAFDDADRNIRSGSAVFSLVATMVGGGVLELPYAMSQCGLALGTIALFASAAASAWTLDMLVECARCTGRDTFEMIGHFAYGELMRVTTTTLVFVFCWLALVAYFVLLADLLVPVVSVVAPALSDGLGPHLLRQLVTCVAAGLLSPMCFKANLHSLRFMCYASVCSSLLVGLVIGLRAGQSFHRPHDVALVRSDGTTFRERITGTDLIWWPADWTQALYAFPMFGVSFLCHFNALPTHQELQRPTRVRIRRVFFITVCLTSVLYLFMGVAGYLFACSFTCGNILLNFGEDDHLVIGARVFFGVVLMLNLPLLCQPSRNALFRLLLSCRCLSQRSAAGGAASQEEQPRPTPSESSPGHAGPAAGATASPDGLEVQRSPREEEQAARRDLASPFIHVYRRQDTGGRQAAPLAQTPEALDQFVPKEPDATSGATDPTPKVRYLLTALLLLSALALSLFMRSILVVWSVLSSTVAFLVAFILPSAFWCRIVGPTVGRPTRRIAAKCLFWTSIAFAVACSLLTVMKLDAPPCPLPPTSPTLQAVD